MQVSTEFPTPAVAADVAKKTKKRKRDAEAGSAETPEPTAKKQKKEKKQRAEDALLNLETGSSCSSTHAPTASPDASPCASTTAASSGDEAEAAEETTMVIRKKHNIRVYTVARAGALERRVEETSDTYRPCTAFAQTSFPEALVKTLESKYPSPSPIQMQAWPILNKGANLVGIAETGSGKTLGFLLPGMARLMQATWNPKPRILVLAPTRELVGQIFDEATKFAGGPNSNAHAVQVVGGMPKGPQMGQLRYGCGVLVATPGRLLDLHNIPGGPLDLSNVGYFVLDEADRMLDMGFEKPLRDIEALLPRDRQSLMFSATWPKEIQKLARELMGGGDQAGKGGKKGFGKGLGKPAPAPEPAASEAAKRPLVQLFIGEDVESGALKANSRVTQEVKVFYDFESKKVALKQILDSEAPAGLGNKKPKVIVFGRTKAGVDTLTKAIEQEMGHWPLSIHGDKEQRERDWALKEFKKEPEANGSGGSEYNILVATDVAARGIDVKNVGVVVNFDFPMQIEDYVHRIGRTGRGGASGKSFSFFQERDAKNPARMAKDLSKILRESNQVVPDELTKIAGSGGKGGKGKGKKGGWGGWARW